MHTFLADQIWGHLEYLVAQIFEKMQKFMSKFWPIFLDKSTKTAENDLTLTDHISATVWSYEASEPILEREWEGLQYM